MFMRSRSARWLPVVLSLGVVLALAAAVQATPVEEPHVQPGLWQDIDEDTLARAGERQIVPERYRLVAVNLPVMIAALNRAPLENFAAAQAGSTIVSLPLPDGSFGRFQVVESPIMEPALAARFPELKTYLGQGLDDPTAVTRFDHTPSGFHAMIRSSAGTIFIDPYQRDDTRHYVVYDKRDYRDPETGQWTCGFEQENPSASHLDLDRLDLPSAACGPVLRTYRLALAATGEYTAFHGGTVEAGRAA